MFSVRLCFLSSVHTPENIFRITILIENKRNIKNRKYQIDPQRKDPLGLTSLSSVQSSEMASSALARISNLQRHFDPTESNNNKVFSFCIQIFKLHNFSLLGFNINALNGLTNIQTVTH